MRPSFEQIERAAYLRWKRRGGGHGSDREDWIAAEQDLGFELAYQWVARHRLYLDDGAAAVWLGAVEHMVAGRARNCRFCERDEACARFSAPEVLPGFLGSPALRAWDECDDCRATFDSRLAGPFETFARPLVASEPRPPQEGATIAIAAYKALVWIGLSIMPSEELHHFGDTIEWVINPDQARDASILPYGLGCYVYATNVAVPVPFASLARRAEECREAKVPYMLFFLGARRVVFQTHIPLCPRDEDLRDQDLRGPLLSMSTGTGAGYYASHARFLPIKPVGCVDRPRASVRNGRS
jgi:hypothetical protein